MENHIQTLRTQSAYTITTFCHVPKYTPILPHWKNVSKPPVRMLPFTYWIK